MVWTDSIHPFSFLCISRWFTICLHPSFLFFYLLNLFRLSHLRLGLETLLVSFNQQVLSLLVKCVIFCSFVFHSLYYAPIVSEGYSQEAYRETLIKLFFTDHLYIFKGVRHSIKMKNDTNNQDIFRDTLIEYNGS